jgi:hypothetical protein
VLAGLVIACVGDASSRDESFDNKGSSDLGGARKRLATIWIVRATPAARWPSPPDRRSARNAVSAGGHRTRYIGSAAILSVVAWSLLSATSASY